MQQDHLNAFPVLFYHPRLLCRLVARTISTSPTHHDGRRFLRGANITGGNDFSTLSSGLCRVVGHFHTPRYRSIAVAATVPSIPHYQHPLAMTNFLRVHPLRGYHLVAHVATGHMMHCVDECAAPKLFAKLR
ncbi:hypothetical protein IW262DRAFT_1498427 [Armillaria fumosa]|nr:hypothetical protein IW262DRAFT_1498427 [Armillaria fumosa]